MSKTTAAAVEKGRCEVCGKVRELTEGRRCADDADQLTLALPAVRGADGKFVRLR
ncbi:hypothetical protein AB0M43_30780 [Longispora sp. NPDC051575]|uniref:hypothetical protein n=1 Tax=Longispora sp. NPDC051575 TaxID=3154943 RepID=UPI00343651E9